MKTTIFLFFVFFSLLGYSQYTDDLRHNHIGTLCTGGSFQSGNNKFTLSGLGYDIWGSADEFNFAWVKIDGDVEISVKINSVENKNEWTKAGIMIRENLAGTSKNIMTLMTPWRVASCQYRANENSGGNNITVPDLKFPYWLKLTRKGNVFFSQVSADGIIWDLFSPVTIEMAESVYYGLAVTSHVLCEIAKAEFENLTITKTISEIPAKISYHIIRSNTLTSKFLNEDVKITVGLPYKFDSLESVHYPVLYFLNHNKGSYHTLIRDLTSKNLIPPVITAGIAFSLESKRDSDYTVNFSEFNSFLNLELLPAIENRWTTDKLKRTIYGHSFGGLACLNTMFLYYDYNSIPFRNIIASSPAVWWPDSKQAFTNEQNLYRQTTILPVNLYMTIGTDEGYTATSNFSKMARTLDNRGYEYLNIMTDANDGKNLASNADLSFYEGSIWALNQPVVSPNSIATNFYELESPGFQMYPNPTSGEINLILNKTPDKNSLLEIINLQGQVVLAQKLNIQKRIRLSLDNLAKGIYLARITSEENIRSQKIKIH